MEARIIEPKSRSCSIAIMLVCLRILSGISEMPVDIYVSDDLNDAEELL